MKLTRLQVRRMPGINGEFTLTAAGGLNLIQGPNGSGKSTVCRAIRALLWPQTENPSPVSLTSHWSAGTRRWRAERDTGTDTRWQRDDGDPNPPQLPGPHLARCYSPGILDLLKAGADETDRSLAEQIVTQMAGGYRIAPVREQLFKISSRAGMSEYQLYTQRKQDLSGRLTASHALARSEDQLVSLRRSEAEATRARSRLDLWQQAQQLLTERRRLDGAETRLASFPGGLAAATGDELQHLEQIENDLNARGTEQINCRQAIADAEQSVAAADLPAGSVPETALTTWRGRLRELEKIHHDLSQIRKEESGAAAELQAARDALPVAVQPDPGAAVAPDMVAEAETTLRRLSVYGWQSEGLHEASEALQTPTATGDPTALTAAVAALEDWLAASTSISFRRYLVPLILAKILVIVGLYWVRSGLVRGWIPIGLGSLGIACIFWHHRIKARRQLGLPDRKLCERAYRDSGLPEPAGWQIGAVLTRLGQLRGKLAEALAATARNVVRDQLENRRQRLVEKTAAATTELGELSRRAGLEPEAGAVELLEFSRRVHGYQLTRQRWAGLREQKRRLEQDQAAGLTAVNGFLAGHGYPRSVDLPAAQAALAELTERSQRFVEASARLERERRQLTIIQDHLAQKKQQRQELFSRVGLDASDPNDPNNRVALINLLQQHHEYRQTVTTRDVSRRNVAEQERDLRDSTAYPHYPEVTELSREALESRIRADEALVTQGADDRDERVRIEAEVQRAQAAIAVEEALAGQEAARQALEDTRDDVLFRTAGQFLLDRIHVEHTTRSRPAVLQRAIELFAAFTNHNYRLEVRTEDGVPLFQARDTRLEHTVALGDLSDGTRAQLLLATRLAFVIESEQESHLPLLLDESLTGSDPVRFQAIAGSLLQVARQQDRQLFYFTADPSDVQAWHHAVRQAGLPPVAVIDLQQVRNLDRLAEVPTLFPLSPSTPPAPDDLDATAYAMKLGVLKLDPRQPAATHLWYLLADDLQLLFQLLQARLETVGQWLAARNSVSISREMSPPQETLLSARAEALAVFCETWRFGRGRSVDRQVLLESGAVSATFLDKTTSLAADLGGTGEDLITALLAGRIPRFHKQKIDELRMYLEAEGYIDSRPVLPEGLIRQRVSEMMEPHLAVQTFSLASLAQLVELWWQAAQSRRSFSGDGKRS
ncbi:MAG: AAA family ATPase [bacterium]